MDDDGAQDDEGDDRLDGLFQDFGLFGSSGGFLKLYDGECRYEDGTDTHLYNDLLSASSSENGADNLPAQSDP